MSGKQVLQHPSGPGRDPRPSEPLAWSPASFVDSSEAQSTLIPGQVDLRSTLPFQAAHPGTPSVVPDSPGGSRWCWACQEVSVLEPSCCIDVSLWRGAGGDGGGVGKKGRDPWQLRPESPFSPAVVMSGLESLQPNGWARNRSPEQPPARAAHTRPSPLSCQSRLAPALPATSPPGSSGGLHIPH